MAVTTRRKLTRKTQSREQKQSKLRQMLAHYFPAWLLLAAVLVIILPNLFVEGLSRAVEVVSEGLSHTFPTWLLLILIVALTALTLAVRSLRFAVRRARAEYSSFHRRITSHLRVRVRQIVKPVQLPLKMLMGTLDFIQYGFRALLMRRITMWVLLAVILVVIPLNILVDVPGITHNALVTMRDAVDDLLGGRFQGTIAPLFTDEVDHWADEIQRWAGEYDLDPNLLATVMQIESCGHPTVSSPAGAQGLFQVMPYHFLSEEDQLDPDTNARRGAGVLSACLSRADGDPGLAMACYNGGPALIDQDFSMWLPEPQRYYIWGLGIYADAQSGSDHSDTLNRWLAAGGDRLCDWAAVAQKR